MVLVMIPVSEQTIRQMTVEQLNAEKTKWRNAKRGRMGVELQTCLANIQKVNQEIARRGTVAIGNSETAREEAMSNLRSALAALERQGDDHANLRAIQEF